MIDEEPLRLYTFPTPNGDKVHILLEELDLAWEAVPVNILGGEQFDEEFLRISPNNKIPALVDPQGPGSQPFSLFESGAILLYLAEKTGRFLPAEGAARYRVMEWLMFQMGGFGPLLGQAHHFLRHAPERVPYALERYTREARRLYTVLEQRLRISPYVGDEHYSIADMAVWPWVHEADQLEVRLADFPHVQHWHQGVRERPAVQHARRVLAEYREEDQSLDERARENLFGEPQYENGR